MSSREEMKFKAAIRAMAAAEGVAAQVVLQHFMFERLFARIVRAPIKDHLIIKGGYLLSHIRADCVSNTRRPASRSSAATLSLGMGWG